MTTTTRCEGRIPDTNINGERCDFQCYETAVACPKCGQDTDFCLECMKLSSKSAPMCEECEGKRLELARASTSENVEALIEALEQAHTRLGDIQDSAPDKIADYFMRSPITLEIIAAALAPFKGVKP